MNIDEVTIVGVDSSGVERRLTILKSELNEIIEQFNGKVTLVYNCELPKPKEYIKKSWNKNKFYD